MDDMYAAIFWRNGIRDHDPSDWFSPREHLIHVLMTQSRWTLYDMFPDITEVSIEDKQGVEWFRIRLRQDTNKG